MGDLVVKEIWYAVRPGYEAIEELKCTRSSGNYIWVIREDRYRFFTATEQRQHKSTSWQTVFPTHEEARMHIVKRLEDKVQRFRRDLELLPQLIANAEAELKLWQTSKEEVVLNTSYPKGEE
jgi:hypothetical protein